MHKELLSKALLTDKYLYVGVVLPDGKVEVAVAIVEYCHVEWHYNFENAAQAQIQLRATYAPEGIIAATIALDLFTEASAQWEAQR